MKRRSPIFLTLCCIIGLILFCLVAEKYSNPSVPHNFRDYPLFQPPDSFVVIYNRIPKTGSTALVNLVYHTLKQNDVGISLLNMTSPAFYLSKVNQLLLVKNLTERSYSRPFLLHGHFAYLDFRLFGSSLRPIYFNMIRDPLERLLSFYYFLRFGDDYRPNLVRNRMSDPRSQMQTFDECVRLSGAGCQPKDLWIQIPFFCGNAAYCRIPGNPEALKTAKRRVVEDYLIVGLTEAFEDFVVVLEKLFPRFFRGAFELLRSSNGWHIRRTRYKLPISNFTRSMFHRNPVWKLEQDFYEFVRNEFWSLRNAVIDGPLTKLEDMTMDRIPWNRQRFFFLRTKP